MNYKILICQIFFENSERVVLFVCFPEFVDALKLSDSVSDSEFSFRLRLVVKFRITIRIDINHVNFTINLLKPTLN